MSGWEPRQVVTVAERDDEGRPTVFHIDQEPEWDDEQIDLVLAAQDLAGSVGPHGIPMSEATSALADPSDRSRGWRYIVPPPRIDHAQRALNLAQRERAEAYPEEDTDSLLWTVQREDIDPAHPNR